MMIDSLLEIAKGASMVGVAARYPTTSYAIDVTNLGDALPENCELVIQIDTGLDSSGGAATVTFTLETYSTAVFSSARTVLWTSAALNETTAIAGYQVCKIPVPRPLQRYLTVVATIAGETSTAGAFSAFLVRTPDVAAAKAA